VNVKTAVLLSFLFACFCFLVFIKFDGVETNHDLLFHYNHSIGNYVDFDGMHPVESYEQRPPLVSLISQPFIFFGLNGFLVGWFLLVFVFAPVLFSLFFKNWAIMLFWFAFPLPFFYVFSGTLAEFLAAVLFVFFLHFFYQSLAFKCKKHSLNVLLLIVFIGIFSHTLSLMLFMVTGLLLITQFLVKKRFGSIETQIEAVLFSIATITTGFFKTIVGLAQPQAFFSLLLKKELVLLSIFFVFASFWYHERIINFAFITLFYGLCTWKPENERQKKLVIYSAFLFASFELFRVNTIL